MQTFRTQGSNTFGMYQQFWWNPLNAEGQKNLSPQVDEGSKAC